MLKKFLHRAIRRFERQNDYDAAYMHAMADSSPALGWRFLGFSRLSQYGKKAPPRMRALAVLAAMRSEDCGPCLQLSVDFALQAGLDSGTARTAVQNPENLSGEDRLVFDYATAVSENREDADALRRRVEERFGPDALIELAMAVATARVYPTVKRGMGYAKSCRLVSFDFRKAS